MLWKIAAGLIAGCFAGALVIAFLPHIQPSAASQRAAVEQPVFVAQPVAVTAPKAAVVAHPIAREAISKLASALRGPSAESDPIVSLSIPIDDARRLLRRGPHRLRQGRHRDGAGFPRSARPKGATPGR